MIPTFLVQLNYMLVKGKFKYIKKKTKGGNDFAPFGYKITQQEPVATTFSVTAGLGLAANFS